MKVHLVLEAESPEATGFRVNAIYSTREAAEAHASKSNEGFAERAARGCERVYWAETWGVQGEEG